MYVCTIAAASRFVLHVLFLRDVLISETTSNVGKASTLQLALRFSLSLPMLGHAGQPGYPYRGSSGLLVLVVSHSRTQVAMNLFLDRHVLGILLFPVTEHALVVRVCM